MPAPTYRIEELARLTGCSPRTIRFYVERGLLPGPKPRGVGTRYSQEQLARLFAIRRLREDERLRLDAIKRRLSQLSAAELAAMIPQPSAAPAHATEAPSTTTGPAAPATSSATAATIAYQRWDYVELIPGLELRIRSDASPVLRRLAQEIHARYAAAAPADEAPPE